MLVSDGGKLLVSGGQLFNDSGGTDCCCGSVCLCPATYHFTVAGWVACTTCLSFTLASGQGSAFVSGGTLNGNYTMTGVVNCEGSIVYAPGTGPVQLSWDQANAGCVAPALVQNGTWRIKRVTHAGVAGLLMSFSFNTGITVQPMVLFEAFAAGDFTDCRTSMTFTNAAFQCAADATALTPLADVDNAGGVNGAQWIGHGGAAVVTP